MKDEKKTDALFDAVGKIDPEFLMEAENARPAVRTRPIRRVLPIAAAVAALAVLVAILSVFLPKNGLSVSDGLAESAASEQSEKSGSANKPSPTPSTSLRSDPMEEILLLAAENAEVLEGDAETCRLQPGVTWIVWQTETDGPCYFHELTPDQLERLERLIPEGSLVGSAKSGSCVRVWLVRPDGTVRTPYLRQGKGNEDFLRLMDYAPELIPSNAFLNACRQILLSGG